MTWWHSRPSRAQMLLLPPSPRPPTSSSAAGAAKRSVTARSPGTSVGSTESSSTCQTTVPNGSGWSTAMSAPNWSRSSSSANATRRVVAGAGRGQRTNGGPLREQDTGRVVTLLQPRVRCTAAEPTKRRGKDSHGPTAQHPRSGPARPPMVGASSERARRAGPALKPMTGPTDTGGASPAARCGVGVHPWWWR